VQATGTAGGYDFIPAVSFLSEGSRRGNFFQLNDIVRDARAKKRLTFWRKYVIIKENAK
jgi:hypothetical protein